jgi:hypothetical protein
MVPEVRPKPLYRGEREKFARLLGGSDMLSDACEHAIKWVIAAHKASREYMKQVEGHTPAKWAAELRRIESRMYRGHDGPEITRTITDPLYGADDETFERLHGIVGDPEVPLEHRLAEIEARRRELELAFRRMAGRHGARSRAPWLAPATACRGVRASAPGSRRRAACD